MYSQLVPLIEQPPSLAFDPVNNYILLGGPNNITVFNQAGQVESSPKSPSLVICGIAVDKMGRIYVLDDENDIFLLPSN